MTTESQPNLFDRLQTCGGRWTFDQIIGDQPQEYSPLEVLRSEVRGGALQRASAHSAAMHIRSLHEALPIWISLSGYDRGLQQSLLNGERLLAMLVTVSRYEDMEMTPIAPAQVPDLVAAYLPEIVEAHAVGVKRPNLAAIYYNAAFYKRLFGDPELNKGFKATDLNICIARNRPDPIQEVAALSARVDSLCQEFPHHGRGHTLAIVRGYGRKEAHERVQTFDKRLTKYAPKYPGRLDAVKRACRQALHLPVTDADIHQRMQRHGDRAAETHD